MVIVTVVNDWTVFDYVYKSYQAIAGIPVLTYDNSSENVGISARYNKAIEQLLMDEQERWIFFCHQDFGFLEDPRRFLQELNVKRIYGPVGARLQQRWPSWLVGRTLANYTARREIFGQFTWGDPQGRHTLSEMRVSEDTSVDTLDCCCLAVHTSLLRALPLRFDEQLSFHMYAEDFSLAAKHFFDIGTYVKQMECFHISEGGVYEKINGDYVLRQGLALEQCRAAFRYLQHKYALDAFGATLLWYKIFPPEHSLPLRLLPALRDLKNRLQRRTL